MATENEHLKQAQHNRKFLDAIDHENVWKLYQPLYSYSRLTRYWCMRVKPDDVPYITRRLNKIERKVRGRLASKSTST